MNETVENYKASSADIQTGDVKDIRGDCVPSASLFNIQRALLAENYVESKLILESVVRFKTLFFKRCSHL